MGVLSGLFLLSFEGSVSDRSAPTGRLRLRKAVTWEGHRASACLGPLLSLKRGDFSPVPWGVCCRRPGPMAGSLVRGQGLANDLERATQGSSVLVCPNTCAHDPGQCLPGSNGWLWTGTRRFGEIFRNLPFLLPFLPLVCRPPSSALSGRAFGRLTL